MESHVCHRHRLWPVFTPSHGHITAEEWQADDEARSKREGSSVASAADLADEEYENTGKYVLRSQNANSSELLRDSFESHKPKVLSRYRLFGLTIMSDSDASFFETTGAEQPNQLELGKSTATGTGNRRAQRGDSWSSGSHTPSDSSFDSEVSVQDSEDERKTSPFRGLLALKQRLAKAKAEQRAALHAKREERRERVLEVGQGVTTWQRVGLGT